jgi:hypothetical protein
VAAASTDIGVESRSHRTLRIGTDLVVFQADRALVIARAAMDGWDVRQHRHALIHFDDRRWRIVNRAAFDGDTVRYELEPWEPNEHEVASIEIHYTPDYVAARDRAMLAHQKRQRASLFFIAYAPFTGFLPASVKDTLESRYGIDPVKSSWHSVIIEYLVALVSLALASIGMISGKFSGMVFIPVAIVIAVDGVIRWERILGEERPPPGFYEWLFRPNRDGA